MMMIKALGKKPLINALSLGLALAVTSAHAADFPDDDIKFISPAAPGGGSDYLIRSLQPSLEKQFGVNIIPQYLSGCGGACSH
ncbi:hypothetical protein [Larsenimonas salina]|uniref:hypothetical protein n=1 Tax=Larsenimonas salina TaxID=1295565 RepID=UPI00207399DF|nr:hypothetical protein [Larsenimonas salina]MCM5704232.1 hypothetical protein [Larsenimonas salina]